jgi:hypothetical protein
MLLLLTVAGAMLVMALCLNAVLLMLILLF